MRVTARLSQAAADGWISPDELKVLVNAQNLFGTAAQGRRIEASLTLRPSFPALRGFAEYTFYDPQHAKEEFSDTLPAQTSDEKGDAQFELGLKRYARATYQIDFVARAFEATGGRGVTAQTSALVSSVPYLVGWKADGALNFIARSAARGVEMIAVDAALKKVAAAGLKLERVERKYVSILTKQPSGVYKYESHQKETVLETKDASITAAGVTLALDTGTPGDFALVLRDAGHVELSRVEYSVAGAANLSRSLERNAELAVVLNKKDFDPGEDISISVRAPYVGSGLITIERDKVYAATWFKSTSTSSVQKIRIPKDFAGNGYVTVQYLRDPSSDEIFMSPLTYGVAPFSVSLAKHENELKFTVPAQSRPGTAVAMHLQAQYPAKVVVFAVDEGILQVARYKAPDPLGFFFQKRALQVRTSQILDLVLPEYRKLLSAMAPGGDEEAMRGRNLNPFRRRGEKSVVYWSGLLDVGKAGVDLKYEVPDYFSGSLKFFAVAVNADTIGVYQGRNIVRGDFVISPNAPLMLAPGDEVEVSASVANNLRGSGKAAMPSVQLQTGPGLTILGEDRVKLAIAENSEGVTRFHLKANDKLGPEQLKFLISLNGATAARTVALSIRPANPRSTTLTTGSLEDNSRDEPLKHNFYAEQRQVEAALAFNPLVLVRGIAAWLNHYDYYCSEQLLSQAVPAMLILSNPELGRIVGKPGQDGAQALAALIATLRTRQTTAGAYALWPNGEADEYVSAYVQDLLLEARQRGAEVPADMVLSGNEYLRGLAKTDATTLGAARARAYAIYLLTRQGEVTSNLVAGLQRTLDERFAGAWRSDILAGYLAATFQLQQQLREGVRLIEPLEKILRGKQQTVNDTWLDYYDSSVRDAVVVRLIARHFPNRVRDLPADMVDRLAEPIRVGHFNTHSAAMFLLALDALGSRSLAKADGLLSIRELSGDGTAAVLAAPLNATRSASLTLAAQQARFTAVGSGRAWFALTESGFERRPVSAVVSAGIEVFREYRNASGQVVTEARVGEDLTAIVRIRALDQRWIPDVAVVDLLPGGFEPVVEGEATSRIQSDSLDATRWVPANVEWREDRLVLYGAVSPEVRSYIYHVRPTSVGSFVVPAISAESMYRPALQARGVTGLFKVTKP